MMEKMIKLDAGNSKKYKIKAIWDNHIYARESKGYLLQGFYYLVSWKDYLKDEDPWEFLLAVQHL